METTQRSEHLCLGGRGMGMSGPNVLLAEGVRERGWSPGKGGTREMTLFQKHPLAVSPILDGPDLFHSWK